MTAALRRPMGLPARQPWGFTLDGRHYPLGGIDTQTWVEALVREAPGCWWAIVPGALADDDREHLLGRLFTPEDPFDLDDLEDLALAVVEAILATDFWVARRLVTSAWSNWLTFNAWCCSAGGVDPLDVHPARLLAAVWAWRCSLVSTKRDATALEAEVWAPGSPPRASGRPRDAVAGWDDEQEAATFARGVANLEALRKAPR